MHLENKKLVRMEILSNMYIDLQYTRINKS